MKNREYGIKISGVGHCLPSRIETNEDLCKNLDVGPDWIIEKTGIERRFKVDAEESCSSLATVAAKKAIENGGLKPADIDLIIVCTFSGDYIFPPVSAKVHFNLKCGNAQIFDLQANCCGLVTGITVASDRMFSDPDIRNALVIGAEVNSRYIDTKDSNTAIYLSDGSGAVVLSKTEKNSGILSSYFYTDSSNFEAVRMRGGGSSYRGGTPFSEKIDPSNFMEMNGVATWKQAITHLPHVIRKACEKSNITIDEIDFIIFHQANKNMIDYIVKKMNIGIDKTYINVDKIGNTGAASVGIALSEAFERGLIKPNKNIMLAAVGAGFNFGASLWRWDN